MNQVRTYNYEVAGNETVTFSITPIGTAGTVTASQNGETIPNSGNDDSPKFSFPASTETGYEHYAKLEFSFHGDEPEARFEVNISGSNGGSYDVTPIEKSGTLRDPTYTFVVV